MTADPRLVLASTSGARAQLLARLEVPFMAVPPRFDEQRAASLFAAMPPAAFAAMLARGKAESLAPDQPGAFILAADQILVFEHQLMCKPASVEEAVTQLRALSGREHDLITAVCLLDTRSGTCHEALDQQHLVMRAFDEHEARRYVERHRPLECVGSYRIEDAGIKLFDRLEGTDFTGIIGLPLLAVARLLRQVGVLP